MSGAGNSANIHCRIKYDWQAARRAGGPYPPEERGLVRKTVAIIATFGLLAVLTACSSAGAPAGEGSDGCTPQAMPGSSSKTITTTGDFGKTPKTSFPTPLKPSKTERSVLIDGSGEPAAMGQKIIIELNVYNGTTGKDIELSQYNDTSAASFVISDNTMPGLTKGLECSRAGERVAVAVPPIDGFGPAGGNEQIGVGKDDSLVFVMDVKRVYPGRADGADQPAQKGFPSVVLAPNGAPGITIPPIDVPTELKIADLKKGDGPVVKKGDSVTVQYTGVTWADGKVFDSSWEKGAPASLSTDQVVPGFSKALVGQAVGSQVIAVIPPAEGYKDKAQGTIPANSTLVFVIDILGID